MRKPLYAVALLLAIAGSFLAGTWYSKHSASANRAGDRRILYYHDPMHPAYKSDKPGIAPDCGMQLEPVYADGAVSDEGTEVGRSLPPGTVQVSQGRQQLIGVKVAAVEKIPGSHVIRIPGRVVPDETRVYRINAASDGWVREICPVTTGTLVAKDDLLAKIYAPEIAGSMKAYLFGLNAMGRYAASGKETKAQLEWTDASIEGYRNALRNQGMSDRQLDEIQRTREGATVVEIRATESGFIVARGITLGQRFERGTELYRIADLSRVWILADLFGREARQVRPGTGVRVSLPDQGLEFSARVSDVLPQFDPATRTLKVRLEANNPGYALRPDMFVDAEFPLQLEPAITVPSEAVLDTGLKKIVFVDRGNGLYEPRRVETGWRMGGLAEIRKGLTEGERVVVSGNFLIDSESRMKLAAAGLPDDHEIDPVCGMGVDPRKTDIKSEYDGQTYYFCSKLCRDKFLKDPEKYRSAPPQKQNPPGAPTRYALETGVSRP